MPATAARISLRPNGHAQVQLAGHDIGTGAYTVVAIIVAERLGLELAKVAVEMGDTLLPPASLAAGSSHTAAISHAVAKACDDVCERVARAALVSNAGALAGHDPATLRFVGQNVLARDGACETLAGAVRRVSTGAAKAYAENVPNGLPAEAMEKLYQGQLPMLRGQKRKDVTAFAYGGQVVEVHAYSITREIRVHRMLGAFACGRIVNPLTTHSHFMGGMIWGLSGPLLE